MKAIRATRVVAIVAAIALVGSLPHAGSLALGDTSGPVFGETTVFARVPYPGQPGAVMVDGDTVWTTTESFMAPEVDRWPVWAFDRRTGEEKVDETFHVPRQGPALIALRGMARDAQGRLYIGDMNGRILRSSVPAGGRTRTVEVYATFPTNGHGAAYVPWPGRPSVPVDIAFDTAGNAFVADFNFPAIWRVPPGGGEAQLWFVDPRLQGALFGVAAVRPAPDGRHLYFSVCLSSSPLHPLDGLIYRIPFDRPVASAVTEVFRSSGSCPAGLAFGASGRLYAGLFLANQVVVLDPDGTEVGRFPSNEANAAQEIPYDQPSFPAFDGEGWLLVANVSQIPANPENWAILKAFVGDTAAPLAEPSIP